MQRVCQFLLIVPPAGCHTLPQIPCGAVDLAGSGTPDPVGRVWYVHRISPTVVGHHAPHPMGLMTDTLRATLRDLAESDARLYRGLGEIATATQAPALPATQADITAAIALLEQHGYTVTGP